MESATGIPRILADIAAGDRSGGERLMAAIYPQLRGLAGAYLRRERSNHTLQPTALVHEAYLRLIGSAEQDWTTRAHFIAVAAQTMRRILVDHARAKRARKRDAPTWITPPADGWKGDARLVDLLDLDGALDGLTALDGRLGRVVELRFFAGLTVEETAEALGVSARTVKSDWQTGRAWLSRELSRRSQSDAAGAEGIRG